MQERNGRKLEGRRTATNLKLSIYTSLPSILDKSFS